MEDLLLRRVVGGLCAFGAGASLLLALYFMMYPNGIGSFIFALVGLAGVLAFGAACLTLLKASRSATVSSI